MGSTGEQSPRMWLCCGCPGAARAEQCWAVGVARCLRELFIGPKGVASHLLGAVLGNLHAMAQLALTFSWGTSAAHRSPCCGVLPPGTAGMRGAVGKLGGVSRAHGRVAIAAIARLREQSPGAAPAWLGCGTWPPAPRRWSRPCRVYGA